MKKIIRPTAFCALCVLLITSLSSCSMIKNVKERARLASQLVIIDSPEDDELAEEFALALKGGLEKCVDITERVSYKINTPDVQSEDGSASILDKTAGILKNMITENSPGSSERTLKASEAGDTLLKNIDEADVLSASSSRHIRSEAVTDENGKEIKDEDGSVLRLDVVSDNILTFTFDFFTENKYTETNENGEERELTEIVPADAAVIEKYFGPAYDKNAVLSKFDVIKDYLQVGDYNIGYTDSRITAETDMDADELLNVSYVRNFKITADVSGIGQLEHLGDFTVTFTGSETTGYEFNYPQTEE
ncbi:MAG: hypothetical protein IJS90_10495 [Clostridia bacterium]|nr:hypothetical protein [Clostridia bacterium]